MINTRILALGALCALLTLSACGNTIGGIGRDLEGAGRWMQNKTGG